MKKSAVSTEPDFADVLAAETRSVISKLKRNLRAQSNVGDLSATQIAVILRLERDGPATASDLARAEGIRAQSMGTAIAPLEAAGAIAGAPDPQDGRRTILSLTRTGRARLKQVRDARQDWMSRTIRARLSEDEQRQVAAALALLERLVDD
ncbi:MarR family winged helix-turn-helix transcriptional regulator [Paraburkholderia sp. BCC1886]|uniref:MarR family winged helix-turn-helix transcriptional regulator n=1 Tax=Paraburkholderia sp. BCC1886 TaxID=2562670 RepID=UPI00118343BE|nr:MarR family transcriptional regulator [Paraburkholderia sp. BCC1886]